MSGTYTDYGELDELRQEIRILRLLPARSANIRHDQNAIIECSLERVRVTQANPFYALSYVWGPETPLLPISLDGQIVQVRKNLWVFLSALRARFCTDTSDGAGSTSGIRVWADSLCIHQSNLHERSYQVSIMDEIYRGADAVYAWIGGPDDGNYDADMQRINQIAHMRSQSHRWADISKSDAVRKLDMADIAASPYWTRIWIKQEILQAKNVWLFSRQEVINWADLRFAFSLARQSGGRRNPGQTGVRSPSLRSHVSSQQSAQAMQSLLDLRAAGKSSFELASLVVKFRSARCQDSRDRIFALLSLTDAETRRLVSVDYSKPLLQLLLQFYCPWTGERPSVSSGHHVYQYPSFCMHMVGIMPTVELEALLRSESARRSVTAQIAFAATGSAEVATVKVIASMDNANVSAFSGVQERGGYVVSLGSKSAGRGQPAVRQMQIVYTDYVPGIGDRFARIGNRVIFLQWRRVSPISTERLANKTLFVVCTRRSPVSGKRQWPR